MRFASIGLAATLLTGAMTTSALAVEVRSTTNPRTVSVTLDVTAELDVTGEHPEEWMPFTFFIEPYGDDKEEEPLPMAADDGDEDGDGIPEIDPAEIQLTGDEILAGVNTGSFGTITFTKTGTYYYLIDQKEYDHEGYTYDQTQYLVTINVRNGFENNQRVLKAGVTVEKVDDSEAKATAVVFSNEYEQPIVETEEPTETPEPTPEPTTPGTETPVPTETPATESPVTSETPVNTETPAVEKPAVESPAEESPVTSTSTATPAPVKSATTQTITKTATATPKTGDSSNLFRWVVVLAVMLMGAVTCVWYLVITKKHNKDSES
jgi:pilin isopeptide linkage protein